MSIAAAIAFYIGDKILGQVNLVKPMLDKINPKQTYLDRLCACIHQTIDQYENENPRDAYPPNTFPFYHSQQLFDSLTKFKLFEKGSAALISADFEKNPHIIVPTNEELTGFYELFIANTQADELLKKVFEQEHYQKIIFSNATKLDLVLQNQEAIKEDTQEIKQGTQSIKKDTEKILEKIDVSAHQRDTNKELSARLPLLLSDKIIARTEDVTDMRQRLLKNKQVVLVNGMGGIGKTTITQMYLTEYYHNYKHLVWISISTDDFVSDFINTPGLKESLHVSMEDKTPEAYFNAIITAIKGLSHQENEQSLMVIDNVEQNILAFRDYLPHPPHWHILATSRHTLAGFDEKTLDFLSEPQAVALFQLYYKRTTISETEIAEIVKALEYHTLTIEILAKTAQNDGLDVQKTVNTLADNYAVEVNANHANGEIGKIMSYLSSIFDLSTLSNDEIWLLKMFSFLPPQFHRFDTITAILTPTLDNTETNIQKTLTKLCTKGWLLQNETNNEYRLHRIIADVVKHPLTLPFDDIAPLIKSVSVLLNIDETKGNPTDKFSWIIYGKHLLIQYPDSEENSIAILQNNLALVLQDFGDYKAAKELLEKVILSAEKNFGKDHPATAISYSNLALVLQDLGDYEAAKVLLEKAKISAEKNFGKDHPTTAISYSNLATVLKDLGDYVSAKTLLEKACKSDEKNFGKDHPKTAIRYSNLAMVLRNLDDFQAAKVLFEKAQKIFEKALGNDHPNTIIVKGNLASLLEEMKRKD